MEIRTVLLVDDNDDIRLIGQIILESVGRWRALVADSGDDAVAAAARERPDVILLDVMMPGKDGVAVLAELRGREDTARIPVIFMTSMAQSHAVARYSGLGAAGIITKPFDPMGLPDEIRRILSASAGPRSGAP